MGENSDLYEVTMIKPKRSVDGVAKPILVKSINTNIPSSFGRLGMLSAKKQKKDLENSDLDGEDTLGSFRKVFSNTHLIGYATPSLYENKPNILALSDNT